MMTLTLPLSPPHSTELGMKVRAQSSIRGCLQWVEMYLTHGLCIQMDEAPEHGAFGLFVSMHPHTLFSPALLDSYPKELGGVMGPRVVIVPGSTGES